MTVNIRCPHTIAALCVCVGAWAQTPEVTIPGMWYLPAIDGQWCGSPPGFKAEWGWTRVPLVSSFVLREGGEPTQRTEVRVYYSARSLYLAFTCFDADIGKLVRGVSPKDHPVDAPLEWLADVFEMFIQPDESVPLYLQLGVNPNGACYDQARGPGAPAEWNGRWRVATKILDDRWQGEIVIDMSSLALSGQFRGTPPRGSSWKMTFCRSAGHWKEYSSWGVPNGWHRMENFGTVTFGPKLKGASWKTQPHDPGDVIVTDVDAGEPNLGERALTATLANPGASALRLDLSLSAGDAKGWSLDPVAARKTQTAITLAPETSQRVSLPYRVDEGRGERKSLLFTVKRDDRCGPSYYADCRFSIFPLARRIEEMGAVLRSISKQCEELAADRARSEAKECSTRVVALSERIRAISGADVKPTAAIPKAKAIEGDVAKLQLDFANRIRPRLYLASLGVSRPGFAVGTAPATFKVFPDAPFEGTLGGPARISLAGNERESAQFVILPVAVGLPPVRTEVGPLVGPEGTRIDPACVQVHRIGTVLVETSLPVRNGLWPDPLYPTDTTKTQPFMPQPMMVTVHAARDQKAGRYRANVRFTAKGYDALEVPFEVEVYDFGLPDKMALFNNIWFCPLRAEIYYGQLTPERFESFARLTHQYHVATDINFTLIQRHLKRRLEAGGRLAFDFSDLDPYLRTMHRYGMQRVNINFYCSWKTWEHFYRKGIWYYVPGKSQARHRDCLDPHGAYEQHLAAMHKHLLSLGWAAGDLYYVGGDEPWAQKVRDEMRPGYEIARRAVPGIKRESAAAHPGMKDLHDLIDIWCPQTREFDPSAYEGDDREVWMYTCGWKYPPYPCYSVPVPGLAARMTHWVCRKYGITCFLNWGTNIWEVGNDINVMRGKPHAGKRWVHDGWKPPLACGDGTLLYPTPDGPIASQRLLCIRDGTEDYEYLSILARLAAQPSRVPKSLIDEARRLAAVPDDIVKSTKEWTIDIGTIERTRARVAELIVKLAAAQ